MMKKLSILLAGILTLSVSACGTQTTAPILNQDNQNAEVLKADKKEVRNEKPVTKPVMNLNQVKFNDSDFSKFASSKTKNSYKPDDAFKKQVSKNGPFDNYLPYRTYSEFENDVRYTNYQDYQFLNTRNGSYHFNNSVSAYQYAQQIYKASSFDMKRFIKTDTLANSLEVNGYAINYNETHNPPFRPNYKLLPTQAANIMPTFAEIYDYNRYGSGVPYIQWDLGRAASFYQANYARYMGMIMEYGPTDKYKVYDLVHREISSYAGN
jgi:hypothetical protein